jgi:DNA polymerase III delta subunit
MLQVFYGTDTLKAKQKAYQAAMAKLGPDQEIISLEAEDYLTGTLLGNASMSSLFGGDSVYLVDVSDSTSEIFKEFILECEALAASQNLFVCVAGALLAADKKPLAKHASVLEEYKKDPTARFNAFSLADALASKDKKILWLLLEEAKRNNLSSEEIIGTLWWQLKAMRLASVTQTAAEAGMKDFPYQKAKRALRNFKSGEIETKARQLLTLYHEGHRGEADLDLALEEWVLRG